jgi:Spy/CpxP family protein refolding chaperone
MKHTSLSKSVRTIGMMAMLSVLVATTLQQPVQAQSKGNKVPTAADGTCQPLPQGVFYQEFGGITFSETQKEAYRKIEANIRKRYEAIKPQLLPMVSIEYKPGIDNKKAVEIEAATVEIARKNLSITQQMKQLTKKYGKYARFSVAEGEGYTPKQIVEGQQIGLDFEAQTMTILTPEQQKVYQANLAIQRKIQACVEPTPFARIISPLPY